MGNLPLPRGLPKRRRWTQCLRHRTHCHWWLLTSGKWRHSGCRDSERIKMYTKMPTSANQYWRSVWLVIGDWQFQFKELLTVSVPKDRRPHNGAAWVFFHKTSHGKKMAKWLSKKHVGRTALEGHHPASARCGNVPRSGSMVWGEKGNTKLCQYC